jgi:hypothetical protein
MSEEKSNKNKQGFKRTKYLAKIEQWISQEEKVFR